MKILYCNDVLVGRTGTEVVTIETALGLRERGHEIAVFTSSFVGPSSRRLTERGIPVITNLDNIPWQPDIIHSNHLVESIDVAARLPDVPQIFICHDAGTWHSAPPQLSIVRRWLAVDEICKKRIQREAGKFSTSVEWMPNAVDVKAFLPRDKLPDQPKRALILTKTANHIDLVRTACPHLQIDALGPGIGIEVDNLSTRLKEYDVVFATARMALEAMASGCAVVAVDARGLAGMVTMTNVENWRRHNFGKAVLNRQVTIDGIRNELKQYNSADASMVSAYIRQTASLDHYLDRLIKIYRQVIEEFAIAPINPRQTLRELPNAIWKIFASGVDSFSFPTLATVRQFSEFREWNIKEAPSHFSFLSVSYSQTVRLELNQYGNLQLASSGREKI